MRILLTRNSYESAAGYTIGRLSVDEGGFLCWVLEPEDRGLRQDMPLSQIKSRKVAGKTAIPRGTYRIEVKDLDGHAVAQGANDSADGTDD